MGNSLTALFANEQSIAEEDGAKRMPLVNERAI